MKNSLNLGFIALLLVVLGCSCPRLNDLTKDRPSGTPTASPTTFSNTTATSASPTKTAASTDSGPTMNKYNEIKTGMTKSEVEKILGGKGEEISSSSGGGFTFSAHKWAGEKFSYVMVTFKNDKVMSKSQYGMK